MLKLCSYESINDQGKHLFHLSDTSTDMRKVAGVTLPDDVKTFLTSYTPSSPLVDTYISNAMGAFDYYGPNLNGDAFLEDMLRRRHKTFVSNSKFFKYHINKPTSPHYGKVMHATYDPVMHKVVLVIEVMSDKLPDIRSKYDKGDPIFVSMGCAVPFDVCSICGNKAKTPANYCHHLTRERLKIYSDGRMPYMINPDGTFFDISYVIIPADKTAFFITKIPSAEAAEKLMVGQEKPGEKVTVVETKEAALDKTAAKDPKFEDNELMKAIQGGKENKTAENKTALMIKNITAKIEKPETEEAKEFINDILEMRKCEKEIDKSDLKVLSKKPLAKVLASTSASGMLLKPREFQRLVLLSNGLNKECDDLDQRGVVISPADIAEYQSCPDEMPIATFEKSDIDPEIMNFLKQYEAEKSFNVPQFATRKIIIIKKEATKKQADLIPVPVQPSTRFDPSSDPFLGYIMANRQPAQSPMIPVPQSRPPLPEQTTLASAAPSILGGLAAAYLGYMLHNPKILTEMLGAGPITSQIETAASPIAAEVVNAAANAGKSELIDPAAHILKALGLAFAGANLVDAVSEPSNIPDLTKVSMNLGGAGIAKGLTAPAKEIIEKGIPDVSRLKLYGTALASSLALSSHFKNKDMDEYRRYGGRVTPPSTGREFIQEHPFISGATGAYLLNNLKPLKRIVGGREIAVPLGLAALGYGLLN